MICGIALGLLDVLRDITFFMNVILQDDSSVEKFSQNCKNRIPNESKIIISGNNEVKLMKIVYIDCNFNYLGPTKPTITLDEIEILNIKNGECVKVIDENDCWKGIVRFDPTLPEKQQWYVEIDASSWEENCRKRF